MVVEAKIVEVTVRVANGGRGNEMLMMMQRSRGEHHDCGCSVSDASCSYLSV